MLARFGRAPAEPSDRRSLDGRDVLMDIEIVRAAHPIKAGQVVHTTGSPITPTPPAVKPITVTVPAVEELHTIPFFGVALESANDPGDSVKVQIGGALSEHLGRGRFGAVGINSSGQLVRAGDRECVSAPNWIGDCDDSGTVTIRPRRDTRLSVLDFGAMGNGKDDERADDTDAIQGALDCAMRLGGTTDGKVVYLPPGTTGSKGLSSFRTVAFWREPALLVAMKPVAY